MMELIARANAMAVLEVELLSSRSQLESPEGLVHWLSYDGLHGGTRTQTQTRKEWRKLKIGINKLKREGMSG
jgi:hypothetical protein